MGNNHPSLATFHYMASILNQRGSYEEVLKIFSNVLEKRKLILENDHPDTLMI